MLEFHLSDEFLDDINSESVEVLRERLNAMKKLVADRQATTPETQEFWTSQKPHTSSGIIDGNFLSVAFGGALLTIVCVSIYAFYNLYHAVLKKFPSKHTEL
ncbi:unnamed protein product [Diamesa hyperborea]